MKVVRKSLPVTGRMVFGSANCGGVFEGATSANGYRKLHLIVWNQIVDLENPGATYNFPATFYDVTYPEVEIVVKS